MGIRLCFMRAIGSRRRRSPVDPSLSIDQSLLTGEAMPVRKTAGDDAMRIGRPGGEGAPFVYAGTLVVRGQAVAEMRAIGADTEIGKIGTAVRTLDTEKTALQVQTGRLVRNIALVGDWLIYCCLSSTEQRWQPARGLLAGIASLWRCCLKNSLLF